MDLYVSLAIALLVLTLGVLCAIFPRWVVQIVCRHASSYMKEDLTTDPMYIFMFRFYGLAAAGLGLYALYQVLLYAFY
ncbi:MAG: hypothetical protein ACC669_00335 [bacterium]